MPDPIKGTETVVAPPFARAKRKGEKTGGVNLPGEYGGVYSVEVDRGGETVEVDALYKQDVDRKKSKKGKKDKVKIRSEKVMGEAVAGEILAACFKERLPETMYAKVDLVRAFDSPGKGPDMLGDEIYLRSFFIPNYTGDLWKSAYKEEYGEKYTAALEVMAGRGGVATTKEENALLDEIKKYILKNNIAYNENSRKLDDIRTAISKLGPTVKPTKEEQAQIDKLEAYREKNKLLDSDVIEKIRVSGTADERKKLAQDVAKSETDAMERPSGVTDLRGTGVRAVVDRYIQRDPQRLQDYAVITASRLLVGDLGLHNANYGTADVDGKTRIVALDYGTALNNLVSDFNPYTSVIKNPRDYEKRVGLPINKCYKNHFQETSIEIRTSEEMGKAFADLQKMNDADIQRAVRQALNGHLIKDGECIYGLEPVQNFCSRMGMGAQVENFKEPKELLGAAISFLEGRLIDRRNSLVNIGYAILLEGCIKNKGIVDQEKLSGYLTQYPDLATFAKEKFADMPIFDEEIKSKDKGKVINEVKKLAPEVEKSRAEQLAALTAAAPQSSQSSLASSSAPAGAEKFSRAPSRVDIRRRAIVLSQPLGFESESPQPPQSSLASTSPSRTSAEPLAAAPAGLSSQSAPSRTESTEKSSTGFTLRGLQQSQSTQKFRQIGRQPAGGEKLTQEAEAAKKREAAAAAAKEQEAAAAAAKEREAAAKEQKAEEKEPPPAPRPGPGRSSRC